MNVYEALPATPLPQPSTLTIGNFDGVHRGHQALLRKMLADARRQGWLAGLMTFDPHPAAVLRPQSQIFYLTTIAERLDLVRKLGLDFVVVYPFSQETARTPAADFVARLHERLNLAALWMGPDFALGRGRAGDADALRSMGDEIGFEVRVIEPQTLAGGEVRSGRIRDQLLAGEVAQAASALGRRYCAPGVVISGARRGHAIGFPTANLAVDRGRLLPANGVYATWVEIESDDGASPGRLPGVTNIGVRPSFDNGDRTIEAHLIDFEGDLYGQRLRLEFVQRLRPEKRFADVAALKAQIGQDVMTAKGLLAVD